MKIESFSVSGYKNLGDGVTLELSDVTVLHGANNVGKSNILEALYVFFSLLGMIADQDCPLPHPGDTVLCTPEDWGERCSVPLDDMLNRPTPVPIVFSIKLELSEPLPNGLPQGLSISLRTSLKPVHAGLLWESISLNGDPLNSASKAVWLLGLLARHVARPGGQAGPNYALLLTDRSLLGGTVPPMSARDMVPADLALVLYDAKESLDKAEREMWSLFQDTMVAFKDMLGGPVGVAFPNSHSGRRARLYVEIEGEFISSHLLGTGAQQVLGLVARLITTGADIVAIEEPELNLKWEVQERLAEVFRRIVEDPRGPSQILITSHTPAFEAGDFFHIEQGDNGVTATRRPAAEAARVLGFQLPDHADGDAPVTYLSSEGALRFLPIVTDHLAADQGRVYVLRGEPGEVTVLSDLGLKRRHPELDASDD